MSSSDEKPKKSSKKGKKSKVETNQQINPESTPPKHDTSEWPLLLKVLLCINK